MIDHQDATERRFFFFYCKVKRMETNYCLGGKNKCKWRLEKIVSNDIRCFCSWWDHPVICLQESAPSVFPPNRLLSSDTAESCNWQITLLPELNSVRNPTDLRFLVFTSWCNFIMKNSNQSACQWARDQAFVDIFYSLQTKKLTKLHFLGKLLNKYKRKWFVCHTVITLFLTFSISHWRHTQSVTVT